ncbi:GNAT family N-acetyltransferase [Methylobacterium sp. E-025]|nr:GNAT family N-acetyltransferase [Methylobacterium sp. E-025]
MHGATRSSPDLTFPALGNTAGDIDFAFRVKQAAPGPHVTVRWGWNETFQRAVHERCFNEKPFFAIERAGRRLGTISIESCSTHLRLGEFYLLPAFQGRGLGTAILRHCLTLADALRLPVRLEYLRWNPVGSLYRRCGCVELGRTDVHCLMERPSTSPPPAPP